MIDDRIRKYVRADLALTDKVKVSITRIANNQTGTLVNPIPVIPVNISARGIKFSHNLALTTGIVLDLWIKIEDKVITTSGKVVRMDKKGDSYIYAVSFGVLKEYNRVLIASYVKRKTISQIHQLRGNNEKI